MNLEYKYSCFSPEIFTVTSYFHNNKYINMQTVIFLGALYGCEANVGFCFQLR